MDEKSKLRQQIDALDEELLDLLNRRMELARAIGRVKAGEGDSVLDAGRELRVLSRLEGLNRGPLSAGALQAIFGEIMAAGRSVQKP